MNVKEYLIALIPWDFGAILIEHTLSIILTMLSIYIVGWAATVLLPGHSILELLLGYIEEALFLFLVILLSVKMGNEAYKRWFPNGFPYKFIVA